ncbi:RnfABCDGE type electron transport complex subunit G [Cardiobacterium hominis]|uniref:RnfABCDGE type electron transport complex subunit G n=1 Tax=Cardiobacterium hominis TaxID=2718 RepID=UPI0028D4D529|nr:RnfABCDGE type electron transport complex subunit G [Cardiobacterium hominis]
MKTPLTAALRLAAFAAVTFAAVSIAWFAAKSRIETQERNAKIAQFREISPGETINGDLLEHGEETEIDGEPAVRYRTADGSSYYQTSTYKGYNGEIKLLIGIAPDHKTLLGVRVLAHKETPGLGDKIEARIHPWILQFAGKTLENTRFAVKKDGGDIDSFTGATITPRAVTNQIGSVLRAAQEQP